MTHQSTAELFAPTAAPNPATLPDWCSTTAQWAAFKARTPPPPDSPPRDYSAYLERARAASKRDE